MLPKQLQDKTDRLQSKTNGQHNASNFSRVKHSTALSFYLNQRKTHALILTETHRELAAHEINIYSATSYCGTTGQGGVSILVMKDITQVPKIFNASIDSVWTIVTINRIPILLGAVHIPPTSSPKLQAFISQLEETATFSNRHNLELLPAGDIYARHPIWGERSTNEHDRTLVNALHDAYRVLKVINDGQPNFVSTNGNSGIDIFITPERITETTNFIVVDHETELFTGAPTRGFLPVWLNMKREDTREVKHEKKPEERQLGKILPVCRKPSNRWDIVQDNGRQFRMVATERIGSNCFRTTYSSEECLMRFGTVLKQRIQFETLRDFERVLPTFSNLERIKQTNTSKGTSKTLTIATKKNFVSIRRVNKLLTDKVDARVSPL